MIRRSRNFQHINNNNNKDIRPLIIIAKNNDLSLKLTCDVLESRGYRTLAVTNNRMIIEAALHHKPDLLLVDINSLLTTTTELIQKITRHKELKNLPLLIIKNDDLPIKNNEDIYVDKSVSTRQLVDRIELEITKTKKQNISTS